MQLIKCHHATNPSTDLHTAHPEDHLHRHLRPSHRSREHQKYPFQHVVAALDRHCSGLSHLYVRQEELREVQVEGG